MAQFAEIRRRLARFRRILLTLQVGIGTVIVVASVSWWLMTGDGMGLFLGAIVSVGTLIGIFGTRRDLRPDDDLRGTVRRLNAKKKFYRKRLGIRVRFSWFPFGEFGFNGHRK